MESLLPCLLVGCGYVGTRLARRVSGTRSVCALVRSGRRADALGVRTLRLDLDDEQPFTADVAALASASAGAALVYLVPPPDTGSTDPRLGRCLSWLGAAKPAVVVYMSTTGVYGDTGGERVDEDSPLKPANDRSRRRVAAEHTARDWCEARSVRLVVLRVPGIYGPHRLPLERLARGDPAVRLEEAGPGNRIHVDDLVTALLAAVDREAAVGVFNVTDGDPASTTEFLQQTARAAGLPPPELVTRAEAAARVSPGMLAFLLESRQVDGRRMLEGLDLRLRYPDLKTGIEASLAEMHGKEAASS